MTVKIVKSGVIGSNCYLVSAGNGAVIIDPYVYSPEVKEFAAAQIGKELAVLLTHCHFDHMLAAPQLRRDTGARIYIHKLDNAGLSDPGTSLARRFHESLEEFSADVCLEDGQRFCIGDIDITVMHTPGHTPGGCCYIMDNVVFTGDTLFNGTVGRTDFEGSDFSALQRSLKKLSALNGDCIVYPGHGAATVISHEISCNPYLKDIDL